MYSSAFNILIKILEGLSMTNPIKGTQANYVGNNELTLMVHTLTSLFILLIDLVILCITLILGLFMINSS